MASENLVAHNGQSLHVAAAISGQLVLTRALYGEPPELAVTLTNHGDTALHGLVLQIRCERDWVLEQFLAVDTLAAGEKLELRAIKLKPKVSAMKLLTNAEQAAVQVLVKANETALCSTAAPLHIYSADEFDWSSSLHWLAAHIQPNHTAIASLVSDAVAIQSKESGHTEFEGYQGADGRPEQQAAAIYGALQRIGVTYLNHTPGRKECVQRLRSPSELGTIKQGNCIDLALWMAAALERCGLNAGIIVLQHHAMVGLWLKELPDEAPEGADHAPWLRALAENGEMVVFDATIATHRPPKDFKDASVSAKAQLEAADGDVAFMCTQRARLSGILSLNQTDGAGLTTNAGMPVSIQNTPSTPPLAPMDPASLRKRKIGRYEHWESCLMDLTLRNSLLNSRFKECAANARLTLDGLIFARAPGCSLLIPTPAQKEFLEQLDTGTSFTIAESNDTLPDVHDAAENQACSEGLLRELHAEKLRCVSAGASRAKSRSMLDIIRRRHEFETEERGSSSLHVALGFVRWHESKDPKCDLLAPLVISHVSLSRTSARAGFTLRDSDGEPLLNLALVLRLKRDFNIDLMPCFQSFGEENGIDLDELVRQVRAALLPIGNCEVISHCALGFFDYSKAVMARDLRDIRSTARAAPNSVLGAMAPELPYSGPAASTALLPTPAGTDQRVPTGHWPLVRDCDSSQLAAVEAAMAGRSFVLQGPPGTGKSQTITNITAALLSAGKTVLFVAEKRAALDVVLKRMRNAGLGSACLDLHDRNARAIEIAQDMLQTLEAPREHSAVPFKQSTAATEVARAKLAAYVAALHAPTALGCTFHQMLARRQELAHVPEVAVQGLPAEPMKTTGAQLAGWLETLRRLEDLVAECGGWTGHPLAAVRCKCVGAQVREQARTLLREADAAMLNAAECADRVSAALGLPAEVVRRNPRAAQALLEVPVQQSPDWVRRLSARADCNELFTELRRLGAEAAARESLIAALDKRWTRAFLARDHAALHASIVRKLAGWKLLHWWTLRLERRELRPLQRQPLKSWTEVLEDLARGEQAALHAQQLHHAAHSVLDTMGIAWRKEETTAAEFAHAVNAEKWRAAGASLWNQCGAAPLPMPSTAADAALRLRDEWSALLLRHEAAQKRLVELLVLDTAAAFGCADPLADVPRGRAWLQQAQANIERLDDKARSEACAAEAHAAGLGGVVDALRNAQCGTQDLAAVFEVQFVRAWTAAAEMANPVLAQFHGRTHDRTAREFAEADQKLLDAAPAAAMQSIAARRPPPMQPSKKDPLSLEIDNIRRESKKKMRPRPLRRFLCELRVLRPLLKPCVMISPLNLAKYFAPDAGSFDTVIFDEASQIPVADAVGSLWRAKQIIVVGDSKQLPPTTFFQASANTDAEDNESEGVVPELESVLEEAGAAGVPQICLIWHYRSRDERLIAFSNERYYDNQLLTFPGAEESRHGGVRLEYVPGRFTRGSPAAVNAIEAERVCAVVRECAAARPDASIGVVAFNIHQRDLIEKLLEKGRDDDSAAAAAAAVLEPLFIKNLENVQGDERDIIVFSTTYAKDEDGHFPMVFGPLNLAGGERRLNVAITRARQQLIVVTSMQPEEIDLGRTSSVGVRDLKAFLSYARCCGNERGERARRLAGHQSQTAIEREVRAVLEQMGCTVDAEVGHSGYRIDLAVRENANSHRYILGVECDGANYNAAANTRDRDRLRQMVLASLGWRLHRIWSPDWIRNRAGETERLRAAVAQARQNPARCDWSGANATQ